MDENNMDEEEVESDFKVSLLPAGMNIGSDMRKAVVSIHPVGVYLRSKERIIILPMPGVPLKNIQVAYEFEHGKNAPNSPVTILVKAKPEPPIVANEVTDWVIPGFENNIETKMGVASDIDLKIPPLVEKKDGLLLIHLTRIPEELRLLKAELYESFNDELNE